jgi:broad specificity phosphatase PhoE
VKKIYFVRHGESEANIMQTAGILSGVGSDPQLTSNGRAQAREVGQSLKGKGIELIVTTPLSRARDTAKIIAQEIGYDPDKVTLNSLFTERDYGIYEGEERSSGNRYMRDLKAGKLHSSAETTEQTYARLEKGLEWLKKQKASNILLVGHGGSGRMIKVILRGVHHSKFYEVERLANTEIFEFTL